jgi:hypothetical protein
MPAKVGQLTHFGVVITATPVTPEVDIHDQDYNIGSVATLPLTPSADEPFLYYTSTGYTFQSPGTFRLLYNNNGSLYAGPEDYEVAADPTTDYVINQDAYPTVADSLVPGGGGAVTLSIYDSSGSAVASDIAAALLIAMPEWAITTPHVFTATGTYFLVWSKNGTPFWGETVNIFVPTGLEVVNVQMGYLVGDTSVAQQNVTVIVSDSLDNYVTTGVTDLVGDVEFLLPPGTYTLTFYRTGDVFSANNCVIEVVDSDVPNEDGVLFNNIFSLIVPHKTPTTAPQTYGTLCKISATLLRLDGSPMSNADVFVEHVGGPIQPASAMSFGSQFIYRTDSNGYVEFDLIQGSEVAITIAPTSLRRLVTVPATATANLLTIMDAAEDVFDVVVINTPSAVRRS